jgi:hypothetical protein
MRHLVRSRAAAARHGAGFDLPDGTTLVVEVDGRGHPEVQKWMDDLDRQNEVVIDGPTELKKVVRAKPAVQPG